MTARRPAAAGLGALAVLLASTGADPRAEPRGRTIEVASWWTSSSERPALEVLIDRFEHDHPGVTVDDAAVVGGAGSNVQIMLARRLRAGDPPDIWQTFLGASLQVYARHDDLLAVDPVFERTGLADAIPAPMRDAATWNGRRWGVPTGAHRGNMLWFDPGVLRGAGVSPPSPGTTIATFIGDLATLRRHGVTPLCLGARDRFTTTELFENILLGVVGTAGWSDIAADRFDWTGTPVREALRQLGTVLDAADPDAGSLTWDAAAKRLAGGKCAFLSMNDSVYGELVADGVAPDAIGSAPFPGTDGAFLAIVDTFVVAKHAADGDAARQFLSTIASAPTELAFARIKGSAPLRSDIDPSSLPTYVRSAYQAMVRGRILLSITHGELLGPRFQQALYDGVAAFARRRTPSAFADEIAQAEVGGIPNGY